MTCACWLAATVIGLPACDRSPSPPPPVPDQPPAATAPADQPAPTPPPTTRALMDGPRRTRPLGDLPITIALPDGWSSQDLAGRQVLTGPTPSGATATLLASRQPDVSDESMKFMLAGAARDASAEPGRYLAPAAAHTSGTFTILERVTRIDLPPAEAASTHPAPLRIEETLFYPAGESITGAASFHVDDVKVLGLTERQYAIDRDFIRSLIDGVHVAAP